MFLPSRHRRSTPRRSERGYVLLALLLIVALMTIAAGIIIPSITFEIKRDREEEMIHRGVQYSRAIRAYYKKFGRYPVKLEDLESSNNLRFLRKRYKDPLTGKDFQLLHFGDVKMTFAGGIGGMVPGANIPGGANVQNLLAQNPGLAGALAANTGAYTPNQTNLNPAANTDSSQSSTPGGQNSDNPGGNSSSNSGTSSGGFLSGPPGGNGTIGGGPIVGVASTSKKETIREFNHKKKYNEWQFIYDPGSDRGGLLMTPNQPGLQNFGQQGVPGAQGVNGNGQIGQPTGFGNTFGNQQPQGIQNNPGQGLGGINPQSPPETTPQQ